MGSTRPAWRPCERRSNRGAQAFCWRPIGTCPDAATRRRPRGRWSSRNLGRDATRWTARRRIAPGSGCFTWRRDALWVLSGINEGGNLGADVYLSGTVAAAREACLLGKPAIAISQYVRRRPVDWEQSGRWSRHVLEMLFQRPPQPGSFWNVNLPQVAMVDSAVPDLVYCGVDPSPLPVEYEMMADGKFHYRARYHDRRRLSGHDVEACFAGQITISQISLLAVPVNIPDPAQGAGD